MLNIWQLTSVYANYIRVRHSLLVLIVLLAACTTPIQIAGEGHRLAAQKWHALSQYTASHLPNYGFTVSAKLGLNSGDGQSMLALTKISLKRNADPFSVDLLKPIFTHKYICNPQCVQLVEYKASNGEDGNTLLTKYLRLYEFELFAFYGDMYVLNSAWEALNTENSQVLDEYLSYLSNKQRDFSSLSDVTDFLKDELTLRAYRQFINDPQTRRQNVVKQFDIKQQQLGKGSSLRDVQLDAEWDEGELDDKPNQSWDLATVPQELGVWLPASATQLISTSQWLQAKQAPLVEGTVVCSFNDSYFGIIQSVSANQVEVFVQGQARKTLDGIITDLSSGSLFQENAELAFLPMAENRMFSKSDIAPCNIQS